MKGNLKPSSRSSSRGIIQANLGTRLSLKLLVCYLQRNHPFIWKNVGVLVPKSMTKQQKSRNELTGGKCILDSGETATAFPGVWICTLSRVLWKALRALTAFSIFWCACNRRECLPSFTGLSGERGLVFPLLVCPASADACRMTACASPPDLGGGGGGTSQAPILVDYWGQSKFVAHC